MLSCLYIASALFLTDGRKLVRFDEVRSYQMSFTGSMIEANLSDGEIYRFQVPEDWASSHPAEIMTACETQAQLGLTS
jgi:hypothetical protein